MNGSYGEHYNQFQDWIQEHPGYRGDFTTWLLDRVSQLESSVSELQAQLNELKASIPAKRPRGRPRKN